MSSDEAPSPWTATAIAAAVRAGAASPESAVVESLRRIAEGDGDLRAFASVRGDDALAEARALADRPELDRLPLAGVPVAVKDSLDVAGMATRHGTAALDDTPAASDSEVVRRLRAAGAIVVGKTTLPELGIWGTTDGHWGVTVNPRAPRRTPGGSSGGSGAAVAAGLVPLAVGTDGLGSVRIPAAACGVPGFKFGAGTVPNDPGPNWRGLVTAGALASTSEDVALMASVMAGRAGLASPEMSRALMVAVSTRSPLAGGSVAPAWAAAPVAAGRRLRDQGHRVLEADPPYSALDALPAFSRWFGGVADMVRHLEADHGFDPRRLESRTRRHAFLGRTVARIGWDGIQRRWRERAEAFFRTYDVLLTPALAHPPVYARRWARRGWLRNVMANARYAPFGASWNLNGAPAGVVPWAELPGGLLSAVQVVGPPGSEQTVLSVMRMIERLRPGGA